MRWQIDFPRNFCHTFHSRVKTALSETEQIGFNSGHMFVKTLTKMAINDPNSIYNWSFCCIYKLGLIKASSEHTWKRQRTKFKVKRYQQLSYLFGISLPTHFLKKFFDSENRIMFCNSEKKFRTSTIVYLLEEQVSSVGKKEHVTKSQVVNWNKYQLTGHKTYI